jgi:hypothetical protein
MLLCLDYGGVAQQAEAADFWQIFGLIYYNLSANFLLMSRKKKGD